MTMRLAAAVAALGWLVAGCTCAGADLSTSEGVPNADGGSVTDGGVGGGSGGGGGGGGGSASAEPFPKASACQTLQSQAILGKRPVDILMLIDNSCSMTLEIEAVEANVNTNFAQILAASGLDYRVILIAKHGSAAADQSVCVKAPLSGTSCNPVPATPVNGARFFHYDIEVSSTNSLSRLLSTYDTTDANGFAPGGWKGWLRTDSIKTVIEITDDRSALTADDFEAQLFAKASADFGTAAARRYIFHSIIGITANTPTTAAWQPNQPRQNAKCSTAANPGPQYEDLSIRTGGLRFPVCETTSYDAVFQAAAQGVIASAELACDFQPPAPPAGQNYTDSYVEYTSGAGAVEYLRAVPPGGTCGSSLYTISPQTGRILLCPDACERVKADTGAKLDVVYACGSPIN